MKCQKCTEGQYKKVIDDYEADYLYIGKFIVRNLELLKCDNCGDILLPIEAARKIDAEKERILCEFLQSLPLRSFIPAKEAATSLGVSRQALHKHKKIARGLIYQTTFGGKRVYLRKSVELFKKKGDGRFPLTDLIQEPMKIPGSKAPVDGQLVKKAN